MVENRKIRTPTVCPPHRAITPTCSAESSEETEQGRQQRHSSVTFGNTPPLPCRFFFLILLVTLSPLIDLLQTNKPAWRPRPLDVSRWQARWRVVSPAVALELPGPLQSLPCLLSTGVQITRLWSGSARPLLKRSGTCVSTCSGPAVLALPMAGPAESRGQPQPDLCRDSPSCRGQGGRGSAGSCMDARLGSDLGITVGKHRTLLRSQTKPWGTLEKSRMLTLSDSLIFRTHSAGMRPLRSKDEAVSPPEPDNWGDLAWSSRCGQRLVLCKRLLYTAET